MPIRCAKHIWAEKVYECCCQCGQRHNAEHCIKCDICKNSKPLPCEPSADCTDESLRRHHLVNYISQQFRFAPNPIDTEEYSAMSKRLSVYQGEMWLNAQTINSWDAFIKREMKLEYFKELNAFLTNESKTYTIFPNKKDVFKAFELCPLEKVRVIILGQDCYINHGEACGLAFSVPSEVIKIPPSLKNIFTEIKNDCNKPDYEFKNGDLTYLAKQGCLLLNSVLTVRDGMSGSHAKKGWEKFTDSAIKVLDAIDRPMVFLLWGSYAGAKKSLIKNKRHVVYHAPHPSPLSAHKGWYGNHHFTQANEFLIKHGYEPIKWII